MQQRQDVFIVQSVFNVEVEILVRKKMKLKKNNVSI
ncbi:hypothetical protein ACVNPZ_09645 [Staphylococcus aureus]